MSQSLDEAKKRGAAWAERTLTTKTDTNFVKTGKVSLLTASMMTRDIRVSGAGTRYALERAFTDAAEEVWKGRG